MAEALNEINAGIYTFGDLFSAAHFNVNEAAAADYNNGQPDYRRVQVGGLPYSGNLDEIIHVPPTATSVEITVDGEPVHTFNLALDEYQDGQRQENVSVTGLDPSSEDQTKNVSLPEGENVSDNQAASELQ